MKLWVWKTLFHFLSAAGSPGLSLAFYEVTKWKAYQRTLDSKAESQSTGRKVQVIDTDGFSWGVEQPQIFWRNVFSSNIYQEPIYAGGDGYPKHPDFGITK